MDTNEVSGQSRVEQFRDLSETDKNVIKRLTVDRANKKGGGTDRLDLSPLSGVFRRTLRDATDIRNIFQTMPDLHLPREILISAIMSPGDLSQQTLIFGNDMKGCDTALTSPLVQNLENFFITTKKTDTKVAEWVDDALIWSGAHPILIIPEATLDRLVLGDNDASMESISSYGGEFVDGWYKPKGIFGLSVPTANGDAYVSLESASGRINQSSMAEYHTIKTKNGEKKVSLPIRVTDNMAVLRTPAVQKMKRSRVMENAYGTPSLEARKRQRRADNQKDAPGNSEIYNKFYRQPQQVRRSRLQVVPSGKQAGGGNCGHPLEYHLSTEAVMPVCVPGDESNHVGYIILLDANGYPISYSRRLNYYDDIRRGSGGSDNAGNSGGVAGELIQMSKEAIVGGIANASNSQIDRLADLHAELVDADIVARFRTGMMGGDFELSHTEHIDRLMFARTMKNQLTTMLYVPAELMIYMAYEYNEFGIGKSILEDAKSLAAMRAAVTVANVIGSTKNAIPGKDINIELPEDDGDPLGTATFMANEALGLAYHQFPMAISSTVGLAEQLQMSSFSVNVTGNPRFPEVKTSISPRESTFAQIDNELQQQLRDDLTRVFGLTPEMVDNVNQPEFATTAVQNSLMLQKRVMVIQAKTNPMLTDYVRIFTYNSGILIGELMDIIEQNAKYLPDEYKSDPEGFLEEFLNNLTVKLPAPENDNLTKQMELFNNFSETLDKALPAYITEEFFDGYAPDKIKEAMTSVVAAWKGVILRAWMRKRGILRELDVFSSVEDGSPMMDLTEEMSNHVEAVMKSVGGYAKRVALDAVKRKKTTAKTVDEIDKAQKMLEELTAEPVDENAAEDTYGGGQDLANGNVPEVTDELGGDTNGDGQDDLSMDLGDANDGVDANTNGDALTDTNTDAAADTAAETTDATADNAEAPADDAAAKAGGDDLAINLDAPAGAETAEAPEPAVDAPEVPAAADDAAAAPEGDKPAEADTDLNINLDEPPVDGKEVPEEGGEKPAVGEEDLNINLEEPEVPEEKAEPEVTDEDLKLDLGEAPAVKDDEKDKDDKKGKKDGKDDDLTIDLGEPGKPKS
jgi:hypothetical protein